MMLLKFVSSVSLMESLKEISRISSLSLLPCCRSSMTCSSVSTRVAVGVEMLTVLPRTSERAVAEAPIIWFMTSQAALMLMSSNSKLSSVSVKSLPIRRSRMMRMSLRRRMITFVPEIPST